jgi:membrane protein
MNLFKFCKKVYGEFSEDKGGTLSAAFAYFAVFAIAPVLLILISIVGFVFGEKAASGQLYANLSDWVGPNGAKSIQSAVTHAHLSGGGIIALMLGAVGTILAAVGLANQLQNSFDIIFDAVPDPKSSIKRTIYTKIKNLVLLAAAGLVLVISVVLSAVVSAVGSRIQGHFNVSPLAIESMNTLVSFCIFVAILYLIYKFLPDVFIPRKIVLTTAVVIGLLFMVGKIVLGIVIGRNATASAYGAAASLIVLLLWFYYSAQILLLGAEGIKVYGDNQALVYKAKKYTLKRRTLNVDLEDNLLGRAIEKFAQGVKKGTRDKD